MPEDVDYAFHAQRLLESPAWRRLWADMRAELARERDRCAFEDERRRYVSIAESLLTKLERRAHLMAHSGNVEQFNKQSRRVV